MALNSAIATAFYEFVSAYGLDGEDVNALCVSFQTALPSPTPSRDEFFKSVQAFIS